MVALLTTCAPFHLALAQHRLEAPLVLRLPASARYLGMGGAGLVGIGADVLLYNPGMLSAARGFATSMQRYGAQATAGSIATVTAVGVMQVGVGAQLLDYRAPSGQFGDAVRRGATSLSDGGAVDATSSAFTVGIGRTVKGMRVGGAVKYAEERVGSISDGVAAFDLGVNMPIGGVTLGVVAQNLGAGPRLGGERGPLPTRFGVGLGGSNLMASEHFDFGAQVALTVEGGGFVRPAGGVEIGYVPIEGVSILFRNGLRLPRERDEPLITAGLGVTVDRFSLDYAIEPMRGGRPVSHRMGLRIK
jgi:hypothetical protein